MSTDGRAAGDDKLKISSATPPNHPSLLRSLDILKVVAGLAAVAGLLLHLMGTVWYDTYMREWGLDNAAFPKSVDRLVIVGLSSLLGAALRVWPAELSNLLVVLALAAIGGVAWQANVWAGRKIDAIQGPPTWLPWIPQWAQRILVRAVLVFCVLISAILGIWLLAVALALPIKLAATAAKSHAHAERVALSKGCRPGEPPRCIELRRGTDLVGRGPLIDSSPDFVAFYDVALGRPRVVQRAGMETIGEVRAIP